jgi:hypothetical protein
MFLRSKERFTNGWLKMHIDLGLLGPYQVKDGIGNIGENGQGKKDRIGSAALEIKKID